MWPKPQTRNCINPNYEFNFLGSLGCLAGVAAHICSLVGAPLTCLTQKPLLPYSHHLHLLSPSASSSCWLTLRMFVPTPKPSPWA